VLDNKFDELRLTGDLPSPSAVGLRILSLTQGDDFDQDEITKTLMVDPALSGRIIKLATSADKAGSEQISSVQQAAMRLGVNTVRSIALGFTLVSDNRGGGCTAFDYDQYWSESLAMAVAASALARKDKSFDPAGAFTCALMSNVGKLALASVHPDTYSEVLSENPGVDRRELAKIEMRVFEISHYEVTSAMLEDWGLPSVFGEAILATRNEFVPTGDDETSRLHRLLNAAAAIGSALAQSEEATSQELIDAFTAMESAAEYTGLTREELFGLGDIITASWQDWGSVLKVPTRSALSFADQAADIDRRRAIAAAHEHFRDAPAPPEAAEVVEGVVCPVEDPTRILLIDDDDRMLRLIRHHLTREGYEVTTVQSSEEGLNMALETGPQIVITDWMMPGMSGVKLCETLRLTEIGRKMYILIVTAREDDAQVVEAFGAGADDYIVKPFNPQILLARVQAGQRMIQMRENVEQSERARLRQVAELGILTRKLRAAAMTDALTELPNRRYAMSRLKQEWDSAQRTGRELSVVMVDIDHFKAVNDNYGHDVGDGVLCEIGGLLRTMSRSGDILCRIGGEEFLSININCGSEEALTCAERLRHAIDTYPIEHEGYDGSITCSFGIASCDASTTSIDDLLKAADEALYTAKESGRNRVAIAPLRLGEEGQSA
jgi:two-component system, cell cycle response regulator